MKNKIKPKWITEEITILMRKRKFLLKRAKATQSVEDWKQVKDTRNKINYSIKKAKQIHFKSSLTENRKNPKKLWQILKTLSGNANDPIRVKGILINQTLLTKNEEIADTLNQNFANMASKLIDIDNPIQPDLPLYNDSSRSAVI